VTSDTATDTFLQRQVRRTDGIWTHTGTLIVRSALELQPPSQPTGGLASLILPDGSITTPMLAPNAVQELIGSYVALTTFTVTPGNTWLETPAQVSVTLSGARVRCEFTFAAICQTKGQHLAWGIMVDGNAPAVVLGGVDAPENGFASMANGTYYFVPAPGTHRVSIGLNGPNNSSIANNVAMTLYLTEQKR
jgi:hypothetical protein